MQEKILTSASPELSLDDNVEYWHTHNTGNELSEFLGLTQEQYSQWLKGDLSNRAAKKKHYKQIIIN